MLDFVFILAAVAASYFVGYISARVITEDRFKRRTRRIFLDHTIPASHIRSSVFRPDEFVSQRRRTLIERLGISAADFARITNNSDPATNDVRLTAELVVLTPEE